MLVYRQANDEVIVVHCKTGRCLAVEQLYDMRCVGS